MASKPPELREMPTIRQFAQKVEKVKFRLAGPSALAIDSALNELAHACQIGENPNSAARFLRILSAILPEHVNAQIPGRGYAARLLIEHLAANSIHGAVRRAAARLLETEIIVVHSETPVPAAKKESFPQIPFSEARLAFSKLPLRIQALELLREHLGGKRPNASESDLRNAVETLRFDADAEVATILGQIASFSTYPAVKEAAKAVLYKF